jgi:hypothetical protein
MVTGNPPKSLEQTDRFHYNLRHWDAIYRLRAKSCGTFHVCEPLFRKLRHPPAITEAMMQDIFGKIPETRNPPALTNEAYEQLRHLAFG